MKNKRQRIKRFMRHARLWFALGKLFERDGYRDLAEQAYERCAHWWSKATKISATIYR